MTASQQPTGSDKAVEWLALHLKRTRQDDDSGQPSIDDTISAGAALAALRAALAAGDPDVAEALGLKAKFDGVKPGSIHNRCHIRFVTDWTETP